MKAHVVSRWKSNMDVEPVKKLTNILLVTVALSVASPLWARNAEGVFNEARS